jgi:cyclic beta-1,2-glucan synthetase
MPRMDFSKGIPPESSTLVVVPTMLTSTENVEDLVGALEVRFLANRDENLRFGLLTDFPDAPKKNWPGMTRYYCWCPAKNRRIEREIQGNGDTFFLFHRPRQWNQQERIWMGYERKRGKLAELNLLLRGGSGSGFSLIREISEFYRK